ncbi:MAG: hypothetical protein LC768_04315 [Acidobacteria bacterium]|nr:hypothetical protein [Acidobacteriota bacterium]MCA1637550.1 hypothetical protein [Acidobacteriota bacterium]
MKAKSILGLFVLILFVLGFSAVKTSAQEVEKERGKLIKLPGVVKGTIYIKNVSGNNLGNFRCRNLAAIIYPLGGSPKWRRSRIGTGDFSKRKCLYSISDVPAGASFTISLMAEFPNSCDQKTFDTHVSFPMEIKPQETLTYDFTVTKISCTVLK